jgi:drug/metabolite transporter (DMT)-like permease
MEACREQPSEPTPPQGNSDFLDSRPAADLGLRQDPSRSAMEPLSIGTVAYIVFLCALWGGNMVAMKVGLRGVPPLSSAGFRFLLGSLTLLACAHIRRASLVVPGGMWPHLLALAALFVLQHSVFYLGLNLTSASRSVVFLFTQPVFTVLLAHIFVSGERATLDRLVGVALAVFGLVVSFGDGLRGGSWSTVLGDAMVTVGAVCWAAQNVYMKRLFHRADPLVLTFYQMACALPCFFALSFLLEPRLIRHMDALVVLAFLYHSVLIAGLTFLAWTALLRRHRVGPISAFTFLTPLFGVFLGWLFLGDPATPALLVGLSLVAAGIALVNRPA